MSEFGSPKGTQPPQFPITLSCTTTQKLHRKIIAFEHNVFQTKHIIFGVI